MLPVPVLSSRPAASRTRSKTALVASADQSFRQRIAAILLGLRWKVTQVDGGAQAWREAGNAVPEALVLDSWLPDLELTEFLKEFRSTYPHVDLVTAGGAAQPESPRGPFHQELLYALRRSQESDTAIWNAAPDLGDTMPPAPRALPVERTPEAAGIAVQSAPVEAKAGPADPASTEVTSLGLNALPPHEHRSKIADRLPELIGDADCMLEVSRRIRLVAHRRTPVLIEGPTGSGKELVAEGIHRLSPRNRRPFVAINCAAIPEALLEAELFGQTRGAFTGAVQGRVGRIESADGGTLFLDEIGEMPLALQSKLLRFVECGELQRVGDNETVKVDVRIVAATHRPLAKHMQAGSFRSDLYYRLAVFLIRTPALVEHAEDLPQLVDHFMQRMGRDAPIKRVDAGAMARLAAHDWPGNVRELEHVLERGAILADDDPVLTAEEIDFGLDLS
jgi:DNA-binding NtrC family response regulator